MAGIYGITVNTDTEDSQLFVNERYQQKPVTIAKGEGALVRGQILQMSTKVTHGTVTGGPFVVGETITGGTSTKTAKILNVQTGYLLVTADTGLQASEVITGGTSSATATTSAVAPHDEFSELDVTQTSEARGILLQAVDATSVAVKTVAVFTGKIRYADIVFNVSTKAQKQATLKTLQDRGLLVDIDFTAVAATT